MKIFNPYKKFVCLQIPLWLASRSEVSTQAKIIYGLLMRHAGENGQCFPGQATLAAEMGIKGGGITPQENASRTIRRYIEELVAYQLIHVIQPGLHQTNRYKFLSHPWMNGLEVVQTDLSDQDKEKSSGQAQTELPSIIHKKSKNASLSSASPKNILDQIVMENEGDEQTRTELLDQYGEEEFLAAATKIFFGGRKIYLSNIRKILNRGQSKSNKTISGKEHIKNALRSSAGTTSDSQSIAKQYLQDRLAKTNADNRSFQP